MSAIPSFAEVKDIVMILKHESAPGPDGFTSMFFQKMYPINGDDLQAAICDFFKV